MPNSPNKCLIKLNISLKAPLPEGEALYISGNMPLLGSWAPNGKQLLQTAKNEFFIEIPCLIGDIIEFKLTRGSWCTQAICSGGQVPPENTVIKAEKNAQIDITVINWLDMRNIENDAVIGTLVESPVFEGRGLKYPRRALAWLPKCYSKNSAKPFAAIYMHDAQNLFEPSKAFAGTDWKADETITELIEKDEIKKCVVIAVPNSPNRMSELNLSTQEGKAYASFLVNEVMPWAEAEFNLSGLQQDKFIMGSSMGGLMSFQMLFEYKNIFGGAGCLSSAFSFDKEIYEMVKSRPRLPKPLKIYIDAGEYEKPILRAYKKMSKALEQKGYTENIDFMAYFDAKATHCEAKWASRLHIPLKFLLGKKV